MPPSTTRRALLLFLVLVCLPLTLLGQGCQQQFEAHKQRFDNLKKFGEEEFNEDRFLHFLHVPRTAGRTFFACFLKPVFKPSARCSRAYDAVRLGDSYPTCRMMCSHDDFSLSQYLPEDTAWMVQLRDPVDRFLSAYEFATEVASRKLGRSAGFRPDPTKTSTKDVWPWSYLVEFFENDIEQRQAILKTEFSAKYGEGAHVDVSGLPPLDPYDNDLVMSLEDFANHPIAKELLHNGQTLQMLGMSNYTRWADTHPMRACFNADANFQAMAGDYALELLDSYIHVGLTPNLKASMDTLLPLIDRNWSQGSWKMSVPSSLSELRRQRRAVEAKRNSQVRLDAMKQTGRRSLRDVIALDDPQQPLDTPPRRRLHDRSDLVKKAESLYWPQINPAMQEQLDQRLAELDAQGLQSKTIAENYVVCESTSQKRNLQRKAVSLKLLKMPDGRTFTYTYEARKAIPARVLARIRELNLADTKLFRLGQVLLQDYRTLQGGLWDELTHDDHHLTS